MERLPRYKSFFEDTKEGAKKAPSVSLKEKIEGYQKTLEYLKYKLTEDAAPAAAPAQVEDQETAEDVVKKGMSNLAVSIIKDYGFDSEVLDKVIKMARSLNEPTEEAPAEEPVASEDELQLDLGDETEAPAEDMSSEDDLGLDLGDETEAPAAEEPALEEVPAEEPAAETEVKKKSQPEIEKDLDLDDEATKPLDLADFSFKA